MSDNLKLYRTIMGLVLKSRVHFHDLRCLVTFVWAIVGLLMEECVHLPEPVGCLSTWRGGCSQQRKAVDALAGK